MLEKVIAKIQNINDNILFLENIDVEIKNNRDKLNFFEIIGLDPDKHGVMKYVYENIHMFVLSDNDENDKPFSINLINGEVKIMAVIDNELRIFM